MVNETMMPQTSPPNSLIAVDGGGSGCRLVLHYAEKVIETEAGPTNLSSDFEAARLQLLLGLGALASRAGLTLNDLRGVPGYLALAGAISDDICYRMQAALPFDHCRVEEDRRAALVGALGSTDGAIAHCGTGSFLAFQSGGDTRLVGGWGHVLGDEASAHWLVRRALAVTLDVADGLADPTPLTNQITRILGPAPRIVAFAADARPEDLAAHAPIVTRCAQSDDPLARDILGAGAAYIAETLVRLGWQDGMALCLTGGIGAHYADFLPTTMRSALSKPKGTPIDGAITLAKAFSEEIAQ